MSDFAPQLVPVDQVVESPINPWHGREDVSELAESIRKVGLLQPILVRPLETGMLEIVHGHRRFRGARAAGLTEVLATVRPLSEAEALEITATENCQRSDVHPVDEGEIFRRLQSVHGYTANQIAERVGKSRSYVYERLRLSELHDDVKAACFSEEVPVSVAQLVAKFPKHRQPALLPGVQGRSVREAQSFLEYRSTASLDDAEWGLEYSFKDSHGKLPKCLSCMYYQPSPRGDGRGACLDKDCYDRKRAAWTVEEVQRLVKLGARMLNGDELQFLGNLQPWSPAPEPWLSCSPEASWMWRRWFVDFPADKQMEEALGRDFDKLLRVGVTAAGELVRVVLEEEFVAAMQAAGFKVDPEWETEADDQADAAEDDGSEDCTDEHDDEPAVAAAKPSRFDPRPGILAYVRDCPRDRPLWLSLVELSLDAMWDYGEELTTELMRALGWVAPENAEDIEPSEVRAALDAWAESLPESGMAAVVMSCTMQVWTDQRCDTDTLDRVAARFGVTPETVQTLDEAAA